MSAYRNFVNDFPDRCLEVLEMAAGKARLGGREVTLLLMAASMSLVVPLERLKTKGNGDSHPIGDVELFPNAARSLSDLLTAPFIGSAIWPYESSESWKLARELKSISGDPEQWLPENKLKPISKEKRSKAILDLIRNALAHGSLFTRGKQIEEIIFVSFHWKSTPEGSPCEWSSFDALVVSPADLKDLLRKWVEFLKTSDFVELIRAA